MRPYVRFGQGCAVSRHDEGMDLFAQIIVRLADGQGYSDAGQLVDHLVDLVRRDLPYYDTVITPEFVTAMTQFSRDAGILKGHPSYGDVVADGMSTYWRS